MMDHPRTLDPLKPGLPMPLQAAESWRRRGRIKAPDIPISPDKSVSSPHPHEVARVFNSMDRILTISADIIQRDKVLIFPKAEFVSV